MIAFLGGTFDPVHNGHLHAARVAAHALCCPVRLVLSAQPPHRPRPEANAQRRWAMLELACAAQAGLDADDVELRRGGPSYTVDTLQALRLRHGDGPLSWIVGTDAFNEIHAWRHWRSVLDLGHLLVLPRPGAELRGAALNLYLDRRCPDLEQRPAGGIRLLEEPMLPVSASAVRALIAEGGDAGHLLPDGVTNYISRHGLYVRSV
ncbi:MAG: nicotinate-nucleotide adenylyltransferase [Gammaproteobacteria bacterium]|nr:nicotinate-nucleotide adenylyltransferase [Gammaproteobacteria bacterium]